MTSPPPAGPGLEHLQRLGEALKQRGLYSLLKVCRAHYAAVRDGQPGEWTIEHVEKLMGILQLPPFENAFPVRPRASGVPRCSCPSGTGATYVEAYLADRYLTRCGLCRDAWVTLDEARAVL